MAAVLDATTIIALTRLTTSHTATINAKLPLKVEEVNDYCNQAWTNTADKPDTLPGPVQEYIAQAIEYEILAGGGVQSESLDAHSVTYALDYMPKLQEAKLAPYKRVKW